MLLLEFISRMDRFFLTTCVAWYTLFSIRAQGTALMVDYLLVGGGGQGMYKGGGGGGGGFLEGTTEAKLRGTAIPINVGKGGDDSNQMGGHSVFDTFTAYGGGAGSNGQPASDGYNGGCGGGGSAWGQGGTGLQGGNGMYGYNVYHEKYRSGGGKLDHRCLPICIHKLRQTLVTKLNR